MLGVVLHGLYWALGMVLLGGSRPQIGMRPNRVVGWITAWALGFAINGIVAFVANQFAGLQLSGAFLISSAVLSLGIGWMATRGREPLMQDGPTEPEAWTWTEALVLAAVVAAFAAPHLPMLLSSLQDWDHFLYHLPYGRTVAQGAFPSDFAPDYGHVAAAYPPLFYFLYGLNFHWVGALSAVDLTYFFPKVWAVLLNGSLCCATWALGRGRLGLSRTFAGIAVLWLVLVLNWKPNIQNLTSLYFVLALIWVWPRPAEKGFARDRIIGTLLLAGCAWSNYTGFLLTLTFYAGSLLAIQVNWVLKRSSPAASVVAWLPSLSLFVICIAPFLLRNALFAGNPIYPAFADWLGGIWVTPWWLENEGVLRNVSVERPSLAAAYHDARGAGPLVVGALTALLWGVRDLGREARIVLAAVIGVMASFWLGVLHPTWAMAWRQLQPILPLAALVIALDLSRAASRADGRSTGRLLYLPILAFMTLAAPLEPKLFVACLVGAVGVPLGFAALKDRSAASPRTWAVVVMVAFVLVWTAALDVDTLTQLHAPRWLIPPLATLGFAFAAVLLAGLWAVRSAPRRKWSAGPRISGRTLALTLVLMLGGQVVLARPVGHILDYRLNIRSDLEWMNDHLPPQARVLTLEDRLFTLERPFVQASHPKLEIFYETTDPAQSVAELRNFGVTHVYLSRERIFRRQRFYFEKEVLSPGPRNPFLRVLYRSRTGEVMELVEE